MSTTQKRRFRVYSLDDLTHDIRRVRLRPERTGALTFHAGQYVSVTFAGQPARDYSLANLPGEPLLELHIRRMTDGSTSHFVADTLAPGEAVMVEGPLGDCYLRDRHPGPIIGIAGGSGLAPIRCIVESALARGEAHRVSLYFGARAERDIYMEAHFVALTARYPTFRYVPVLSDADGPTERRQGFVPQAVLADFTDLAGLSAYLAGPPVMVEAALPALQAHGMLAEHIHADAFYDDHVMKQRHGDSVSPNSKTGTAPKEG